MEEGVVGASLGGWRVGSSEKNESIKVLDGVLYVEKKMVKKKKRMPMRRVVPRLGSLVERGAWVVGRAQEARGQTAWE